jgi:hypothetical protein
MSFSNPPQAVSPQVVPSRINLKPLILLTTKISSGACPERSRRSRDDSKVNCTTFSLQGGDFKAGFRKKPTGLF